MSIRRRLRGGAAAGIFSAGIFFVLSNTDGPTKLAGTVILGLCALACVAFARQSIGPLSAVWGVTAIGVAIQLRLGGDVTQSLLLCVLAVVAFHAAVWAVNWFTSRQWGTDAIARIGITAMGMGLALRLVPVFGGNPRTGMASFFGQTVQIGEFARIIFIVGFAFAGWSIVGVARSHEARQGMRWITVIAASIMGANLFLLLVFDTGPAITVAISCMGMLALLIGRFQALLRKSTFWLAIGSILVVVAGITVRFDVLARLQQRWGNVSEPDYQLKLALDSAQQGGLIGRGIGSSTLAEHIPVAGSDFVPAVAAADLGFLPLALIVTVLLLAFGTLFSRLSDFRTPMGIAASGLSISLITQTILTVLGALGAIPLTGMSMPALASTGSTLVPMAIALGVIDGTLAELNPRRELASRTRYPRFLTAASVGISGYLIILSVMPSNPAAGAVFVSRGDILTTDGSTVATTDGQGKRVYPAGGLYSDLGFMSPGYASYGIESTAEDLLTCGGSARFVDLLLQVIRPAPCSPADVSTTIDSSMQSAAASATRDARAQVVVSDSLTGAVLSLYSSRQTSPAAYVQGEIPAAPSRIEPSAPGSTFKLITAAAALLHGVDGVGAPSSELRAGDSVLRNSYGFSCPDDTITTMIALSCNTTAGFLAAQVGQAALADVAATYFGADSDFHFDGGYVAPLSTGLVSGALSEAQLARTGIGQESVSSSPLALNAATAVVAVSANVNANTRALSGIPALHIVQGLCNRGDTVAHEVEPRTDRNFGKLLPQDVATEILSGMKASTEYGTTSLLGAAASDLNREVAAKSGTSEVSFADSTTGIDSWVTAIVDGRWVITVLAHDVDPLGQNLAVAIAVDIIASTPTSDTKKKNALCEIRNR